MWQHPHKISPGHGLSGSKWRSRYIWVTNRWKMSIRNESYRWLAPFLVHLDTVVHADIIVLHMQTRWYTIFPWIPILNSLQYACTSFGEGVTLLSWLYCNVNTIRTYSLCNMTVIAICIQKKAWHNELYYVFYLYWKHVGCLACVSNEVRNCGET